MARAIWTGTISFGLVNVPVRLVTAVRDKSIHLHMLSEDGSCRLRRKLYCPETGEEYDFNETARGYEVAPDQYVIIRDEELEELRPEAGRTIEITEFIDLSAIDPIYFDRTYYLTPDEKGARAYRLLVEAMDRTHRVALARFVMRKKQHLAAIRPRDGALLLETMHYQDEVLPVEELEGVPEQVDLPRKELDVAERLIEALAAEFDPGRYHDEYREQLERLIEAKAEGKQFAAPSTEQEHEPRIINLMEALEKSLAGTGGTGGGRKKRPSKTKTKKKTKKKASRKTAAAGRRRKTA